MSGEVLDMLIPESGPVKVVDCTLGGAGHSSLILEKNTEAVLLGLDRDDETVKQAERILSFARNRVHVRSEPFSRIENCAADIGWQSVDAVLMDIGISSIQLENASRGFSFRLDGPLDMRMDKRSGRTASRILNKASEQELERIFRDFGEIRESRKLARIILEERKNRPLETTGQLVEICEKSLRPTRSGRLPVPTLCFQALRIAVNDELEELYKGLGSAIGLLSKGGRIGVISFHSLEDRIVKNIFRKEATDCICEPKLPVCTCGHRASLKIITKKPLRAGAEEIEKNKRAAPARFRVAEKI